MDLPSKICFRVTRHCNARCGFCLAPPDGIKTPAAILIDRLDWLLSRGVRSINFCGGEPTIHPALPELLVHVHARRATAELTTNGIVFSEVLLSTVRATRCRVKVSLHGDREQHDAMVGRAAFDQTTRTLRRLVAADVHTSVQTTIVTGRASVVDWIATFCLDLGVRRLSILPFIPRGNGYDRQDEYGLSPRERRALREQVAGARRRLGGRLDVRWLDFTGRPVPVVEPDGRVVLEGATEALDEILARIPQAAGKTTSTPV